LRILCYFPTVSRVDKSGLAGKNCGNYPVSADMAEILSAIGEMAGGEKLNLEKVAMKIPI